jgi:hypothetical protein
MIVEGDGPTGCVGDCDGSNSVTVDEIVTMVNIALGMANVSTCPAGDGDSSGSITVDEIITAVNNALNGCPAGSGGGEGGGEDCDDGGLCVGGSDAGEACTSDDTCDPVQGACFGGINDLRGCTSDDDCEGAPCRRCRPYGGDGCAANCTNESDSQYDLVRGMVGADMISIVAGTSGAVVFGPFLTVPLPLNGTQVLTIGTAVNGVATVTVPVDGVSLDRIPVSTIACACTRGAEARTCGGVLFESTGEQAANCTPGFVDPEVCPAERACAPVHGPGNTGSGFITCGGAGVDVEFIQDCNGTPGAEPLDPLVVVTPRDGSGPADDGTAFLVLTSAIGTVVGGCTGTAPDYGPDGQFCTPDDPVSNRGTPNSIPFTTNTVMATVLNPADFEGDVLGPVETMGAPFTCNQDGSIGISGTNLAGGFTSCDQPTINDIAVPVNFVAQ